MRSKHPGVRVVTLFNVSWIFFAYISLRMVLKYALRREPTWYFLIPFIFGAPLAAFATLWASKPPRQSIPLAVNSIVLFLYMLFWFRLMLN
jgi:hypothetical protein